MENHKFTDIEIAFIRDIAAGRRREDIRQAFNEKFNTNLSYCQISNAMKRNKITNGIESKFKKGHVPHNKGKKMSPELYEKIKGTFFQKGQKMHIRPVGSERMDSDGYTMIKVEHPDKWKFKHVAIWESVYGEVPKNHVVIFLDSNIQNFDIDNLALISRAEHLYLNKKKFRFDDKELTETAVNIAKLNSKILDKECEE